MGRVFSDVGGEGAGPGEEEDEGGVLGDGGGG